MARCLVMRTWSDLHIVRRLVLMSWGSCERAEPWVEGGRGSDPHVGSPR